jgi:type I restriction enzyme, R subunit
VGVHLEKPFEDFLADHLTRHGWIAGDPKRWNRELALDPDNLFAFLEASQPKKWQRLVAIHADNVQERFLARLTKELDARGTIDLLRRGIEDHGVRLQLCFFRPAHGMAPEAVELYNRNRLIVTQQVHFDPRSKDSIDLVFCVNGLPVATAELKSPTSGQDVNHAIAQYRTDRDARLPLFAGKKRALVHFAVDADLVFMTTRLAGLETDFLPFNRGIRSGIHTGAGNPPNPNGHRTAYLWEEVLQCDSWLDLLERFVHLQKTESEFDGKLIKEEHLIFPRYHQLDATRKLVVHARDNGPGHRYLVQHSAGSGKSNTIAWLAHQLSSLHGAGDRPVFDSTIIVTDRRNLDKQLQDTVYQFDHKPGVVQPIDRDSDQLAAAMTAGTRIIITTLQKFPFILKKIGTLGAQRFAIIVDEAHSSTTGRAAEKLRDVLKMVDIEDQEEDLPDGEDEVAKEVEGVGALPHVSYFAFTATPKAKTMNLFGEKTPEGGRRPFHVYSMRQAIEEKFILDVLQNYTTYKTFFKLEKKAIDDPEVETSKAGRAVAKFMELHPHNIEQKVRVMVDHFVNKVMPQIDGRAKAMVVARSRIQAVKYKQAFDTYIKERGYPVRSLVAFSGTVRDELGLEYTEPQMNEAANEGKSLAEKALPAKFNRPEFRILLVAEKYQTGFDQPLLHTMYVDKRLDGVKAVQTLSRLNRIYPPLKKDTFVLDFVNDAETIRKAFLPYYEEATLLEETDANLLYDLNRKIIDAQVLWQGDIDSAWRALEGAGDIKSGNAALNAALDPAVERFRALEKSERDGFRGWVQGYVRLYAYLLHIVPFGDLDLLKLYEVGRFFLRKLPRTEQTSLDLDDQVALRYYRLTKIGEHRIALGEDEIPGLEGPRAIGELREKEVTKTRLSEIVARINQVFGADLGAEAELTIAQVENRMVDDEKLAAQAKANRIENYRHVFDPTLLDALVELRQTNAKFFDLTIKNDELRQFLANSLRPEVYRRQRSAPAPLIALVPRPLADPYRRHLPVYSLDVAAGAFLENRPVEEEGWVEVPDSFHSRQGMFVAQVVGRSMEPRIPDGSYAVFRPTPAGSREGRILLVELEGDVDPELGTGYTLKRWHSEKSANRSDDEWEHTSIRLESLNPEFEPLVLQQGPNRRAIAEFVGLLVPTTSDVAGEPTCR